ncbi:MAG: MetQ/NlpA family ABC transporter substrate-binding protein [Desulfitobacterium sp.]|nr:MetQ/NlpA family ABC transporter substrate-binding protein [Desulfitobacterium sp.]
MIKKTKFFSLITASLLAVSLLVTGCGGTTNQDTNGETPAGTNTGDSEEVVTLKVGATPVPHAEILELIKPDLEAEGINLEIKIFTEYALPNPAVDSGEIDANFFQHTPYLETYTIDQGMELVSVGNVHIEPMGLYSKKITNLDEINDGDTIAIPNDPSNGGRALLVLENAGLIKVKEGLGVKATVLDVVENPKNLKFQEIEAAQLPRALEDAKITAAVINTNFALEAGLNPADDAIVIEDKDSPFANILVVQESRKDDPNIQKLFEALTSDKVRDFIEEEYEGSIVPAF